MKLRELRELLAEVAGHDDVEVKFAYNYGDYWRTQVAADIKEVNLGSVEYSQYHSMDKLIDNDEEEGKKHRLVIVLS